MDFYRSTRDGNYRLVLGFNSLSCYVVSVFWLRQDIGGFLSEGKVIDKLLSLVEYYNYLFNCSIV